MTFQADLRRFTSKVGIRSDLVVRKVALDLTREIVQRTPVDTGHARSNWFIGMVRKGDVDPAKSPNGGPSLTRAAEFAATVRAGGVFYLTNNLPYIMALEFGHSTQAPAGMARLAVTRWQQIVDRTVRP